VDHQEQKDQCSEQCHAPAIPCTLQWWIVDGISHIAASLSVTPPQEQGLDDMEEETDDQEDLDCPDDKIRRHEMSPVSECQATVVEEDHSVDRRVHDEEADQEQTS